MPLDDLVQVIETIQQRIRDHGDSLRQNETRTRMALIDPLLQALGWDVADPGLVLAESASFDDICYCLFGYDGEVLASIEARGLDDDVETHRRELLRTFPESHDLYLCLTDGNQWELYDAIRPSTPSPCRLLNIRISEEQADGCAVKLRLLNSQNLVESWTSLAGFQPITGRKKAPSMLRTPDGAERQILNGGSLSEKLPSG
jgi:predicted type IV restriction endonuclease